MNISYDQCYNDIRVVIVAKWRLYVFYLHMRSLDLRPISWYFFSQLQKLRLLLRWSYHIYFFIPQFQYMKFMNQFNDQLPVVLPFQLVRAVHRYLKGQGSIPGKPGRFWLRWSSLHWYVTTTTTNTLSQKPSLAYKESAVRIKGKNPKGKKTPGTKQIKNVQRKRKYSRSSR